MGVPTIELALRQQIMPSLEDRVRRNGGVISRKQLSAFEVSGQALGMEGHPSESHDVKGAHKG